MLRRHFVQSSILLVGCGGAVHESTASSGAVHSSTRASPFHDTVGLTTRAAIEANHESWRSADSLPSRAVSESLSAVAPGAEVEVFLGTWCGDSRQQITRLFAAIELASATSALPFSLRFIGVDRSKHAHDAATNIDLNEGRDIRYVPTIIVSRAGMEVGRIVEHPTRSIEEDLHDLLTGARRGFLSLTRTPSRTRIDDVRIQG